MKSIKVELLHRNSLKFISIESSFVTTKNHDHHNHNDSSDDDDDDELPISQMMKKRKKKQSKKQQNQNKNSSSTRTTQQQPNERIWWPGLIFTSFSQMMDTIQNCNDLNSYKNNIMIMKENEEEIKDQKEEEPYNIHYDYYVYLLGTNIVLSHHSRIFPIHKSLIQNENYIQDFITQMEQYTKRFKNLNGWRKALMEALNLYNKIKKMNTFIEEDEEEEQQQKEQQEDSNRRIVSLEEHNQFITSLERHGSLRNGQEWVLIANDMIDWTVDDVKSYAYWYMQQLHSIHENDNDVSGSGGGSSIYNETRSDNGDGGSKVQVANNTWTFEENIVFNTLLVLYDSRTQHRWETIASFIPDKAASECQERWEDFKNHSQ